MVRNHLLRNILIGIAAGGALTFTACSNQNSGTNNYSGTGSRWDTTLNFDGSFTIDKYANATATSTDFSVSGTHADLTSGFKKLTVTGVTGSGGPSVGDQAYGLEIPGYVFILKPLSGDQIIPMIVSGECPSSDIDANWVKVNMGDGADLTTSDVSGTFNYAVSTSSATLPARYKLGGGDLGSNTVGTGSCANGIMTIGNVEMYLTNSGGAIVNTDKTDPANNEFIFGFHQRNILDTNNLDGSYAGLVFNDSAASGNKVMPVKITCSSGVCTGYEYTNVETGATSSNGVTLTLSTADSPSSGLVLGTIQNIGGGATGNVVCMFDRNAAATGRTIGSCVGQDPGDTAKLFNVLFTSI